MRTNGQLATRKVDIRADATLTEGAATGRMAEEIAHAYDALAVPDFIVWKTSVDVDEIMRNGMNWTQVDNLTVGKARIWDWMTRLGHFDASKPNIRAGIEAAWTGAAAMLAVRATVYTHCKRQATRIEKLFATGTGSTASPATMSYEGSITYHDVNAALTLA